MFTPRLHSSNTTGFKGVSRNRHRFAVTVRLPTGKQKHIGCYDTPKEAALIYDDEMRKQERPSSDLNFPEGLPESDKDYDELMNPKKKRKLMSRNTTGYRGVGRSGKRYITRITIDKKVRHLGAFDSPKEAAEAYDRAVVQYGLDISWLNFSSSSSNAVLVDFLSSTAVGSGGKDGVHDDDDDAVDEDEAFPIIPGM